MRNTNAQFDSYHVLSHKSPVFIIEFDGEDVGYTNLSLTSAGDALYFTAEPLSFGGVPLSFGGNVTKTFVQNISGASQKIVLEEGQASIGNFSFIIQDNANEITALLSTDTSFFHRKKTTVWAGYAGMTLANFLIIMVGWVTDIKLSKDGLSYEFSITDPMKWMQRKIFRGAEDSPVTLGGNPVNIMLQVLTSTGLGTNGDYDILAEENGLGIDDAFINVDAIETTRDRWFPGPAYRFSFTINERIKAKQWLEKEIWKILNVYPVIDSDGRFNIKPHKPPLPALTTVQSFDEDNIIGIPSYDCNLDALINEVECHYDWDAVDGEFDTHEFYVNSTSLNARGPGSKPLKFESKGLTTALGAQDIFAKRVKKIFARYAVPPPKITMNTFFSGWLTEVGDIVPVTHSVLPDLETGTRGITDVRMEVINRTINWQRGTVKLELVESGFAKEPYCQISPSMTVVSGTSNTEFEVSSADAAKFQEGWEISMHYPNMVVQSANVTITDISGTTITVDTLGATPAAGWIAQFADYDSCTDYQKLYWFLSDGSDYLGAADDPAHLITA